jgi:hypothetical protein
LVFDLTLFFPLEGISLVPVPVPVPLVAGSGGANASVAIQLTTDDRRMAPKMSMRGNGKWGCTGVRRGGM